MFLDWFNSVRKLVRGRSYRGQNFFDSKLIRLTQYASSKLSMFIYSCGNNNNSNNNNNGTAKCYDCQRYMQQQQDEGLL